MLDHPGSAFFFVHTALAFVFVHAFGVTLDVVAVILFLLAGIGVDFGAKINFVAIGLASGFAAFLFE